MRKTRAAGREVSVVLTVLLLMACLTAWGAPAPAAIGTVSGRGSIRLNGIAAPTGTIVYAGNQIETGPGSAGYITLTQGGKLVLEGSSSAQIGEDPEGVSVKLNRGVLAVLSGTKAPIIVTTQGVAIRAKQASGTFEVELRGKTLKVFSNVGAVLAQGANRVVEIAPGFLMAATLGPGPSAAGQKAGQAGGVHDVALVKSSGGIAPDVAFDPPGGPFGGCPPHTPSQARIRNPHCR